LDKILSKYSSSSPLVFPSYSKGCVSSIGSKEGPLVGDLYGNYFLLGILGVSAHILTL
jgi:hypothetical protein